MIGPIARSRCWKSHGIMVEKACESTLNSRIIRLILVCIPILEWEQRFTHLIFHNWCKNAKLSTFFLGRSCKEHANSIDYRLEILQRETKSFPQIFTLLQLHPKIIGKMVVPLGWGPLNNQPRMVPLGWYPWDGTISTFPSQGRGCLAAWQPVAPEKR